MASSNNIMITVLTNLLWANYLVSPFQMWFFHSFDFFSKFNGGTLGGFISYVLVIGVYTVASMLTVESFRSAILTKAALVAPVVVFVISFTSNSEMQWPLLCLMFEAALLGGFEGRIFEASLTQPRDPNDRETELTKAFVIIVAGQMLWPRLLDSQGIPTHLGLGLLIDGQGHIVTLLIHGFLREMLILFASSEFARLGVTTVAGRGKVLSKLQEPQARSRATSVVSDLSSRYTVVHQIVLWGFISLVWHVSEDVFSIIGDPLSAYNNGVAHATRVIQSAEQAQRWSSQAIPLALRGRIREIPLLAADNHLGSLGGISGSIRDVAVFISVCTVALAVVSRVLRYSVRR